MNAVPNAEDEVSNPIPDEPSGGGSGSGSGSGEDTKPEETPEETPAETTTVTDEKTGTVTQVTTSADGKVSAAVTVPQGVRSVTVNIPCTAGDSTVAVLVHADGTREILTKVARTAGGLALRLDGSATVEIVDNAKSFGDVADNAWFASSVQFASSRDLFNGTGNGAFAPEVDMTRSMLVTVLHRLEGTPDATGNTSFDDLNSGWYSEAVDWAAEQGILQGSNDQLRPNDDTSRAKVATMLMRFVSLITEQDAELAE